MEGSESVSAVPDAPRSDHNAMGPFSRGENHRSAVEAAILCMSREYRTTAGDEEREFASAAAQLLLSTIA